MPTIKVAPAATTTDALSNVKFNVIPPGGAVLNVWGSGANNGDTFGLSIGDRDLVVNGTELNLESNADVVDTARDQILFDEVVGPGQLFMPVTVTAECQIQIHIRYLG